MDLVRVGLRPYLLVAKTVLKRALRMTVNWLKRIVGRMADD